MDYKPFNEIQIQQAHGCVRTRVSEAEEIQVMNILCTVFKSSEAA